MKKRIGQRTVSMHCEMLLDLQTVVTDLARTGMITKKVADELLFQGRTPEHLNAHPLEYLASLQLAHRKTGRVLDIETLTQWLAKLADQPYFPIDPLKIDAEAVTPVMSMAYAQRHRILAVDVSPDKLVIASAEPWHTGWEENLRHTTRKEIERVVANPVDVRRYTKEFYHLAQSVLGASEQSGVHSSQINSFEQMLELGSNQAPDANDQYIVNIVDWLLKYAFEQRASDIHIEPRREKARLRFRIDGVLHLIYQMPISVSAAVTSRLKILGRMDLAEKRKPQDGRLKTRGQEGKEVELRLSTLPTAFGEKMVMRIFDPEVLVKNFSELGFSTLDERFWRAMTGQHHGIILVTGPTGSGKTTTLYSTLKSLASEQVNVCTVEDPIEMVEPAFNQMQVQSNIDLTFAAGLRALLRQDPDIVMVGEIRDLETAEMAIQAALTGHMVFSTLHTNDAPSAITRLLELGVPHYLIKATVLGVMAQRLIRTLCSACKQVAEVDKEGWDALTHPWSAPAPRQMSRPNGCLECRDTGYRGRSGVYELMPMTDTLKHVLTAGTELSVLRRQAMKEGMHSLRLAGAKKVAEGVTTIEEVLRVAPEQGD